MGTLLTAPSSRAVVGVPAPQLRPHIIRYIGYLQAGFPPGLHSGLPSSYMTLMINLGPPIEVASSPDPRQPATSLQAMLFGLNTRSVVFKHGGNGLGISVDLNPLAARTVLGLPAGEVMNTVVHLDDIPGLEGKFLVERLHAASSWAYRFAVLDEHLTALLDDRAPAPAAEVRYAWQRLTTDPPVTDVADLAREVGWSRRYLTRRFHQEAGVPPRQLRRIVRLERSSALIGARNSLTRAAIASLSGYYDQAHMLREWQILAGCTPSQWLTEPMPSVTYGNAVPS
ncbi:helix-turn-helix domain-containing protein [Kribbella sp. NPDC050124]|uniref:helix-turn-helix domain-containing protein n=1 Tax=Kribbella sp. NPDC050124 TaxID=3364114 RepID=UPI0037BAF0B1